MATNRRIPSGLADLRSCTWLPTKFALHAGHVGGCPCQQQPRLTESATDPGILRTISHFVALSSRGIGHRALGIAAGGGTGTGNRVVREGLGSCLWLSML